MKNLFHLPRFAALAAALVSTLSLFATEPAAKPVANETAADAPAAKEPVNLVNQPAPAWTLKNLEGKKVSFADFKGKVVVIDFWATWCGPCLEEIPGYIELQKKYGKDGLVIVGISLDQIAPAKVKKFAKKNGMKYPVLMGDDAIITTFGDFTMVPTTFLINREGVIIHQKSGPWNHAKYEAVVKQAL